MGGVCGHQEHNVGVLVVYLVGTDLRPLRVLEVKTLGVLNINHVSKTPKGLGVIPHF